MFELLGFLWGLLMKSGYILWAIGIVTATIGYRINPHRENRFDVEITLAYISGVIALAIGLLWGHIALMFFIAALIVFPYGLARLNEALDMRDGKTVRPLEDWEADEQAHHRRAQANFVDYTPPKRNDTPQKETD